MAGKLLEQASLQFLICNFEPTPKRRNW